MTESMVKRIVAAQEPALRALMASEDRIRAAGGDEPDMAFDDEMGEIVDALVDAFPAELDNADPDDVIAVIGEAVGALRLADHVERHGYAPAPVANPIEQARAKVDATLVALDAAKRSAHCRCGSKDPADHWSGCDFIPGSESAVRDARTAHRDAVRALGQLVDAGREVAR